MRYYVSLLLLVLFSVKGNAQNTVKMSAVKATDYGVSYSLPKTSIVIKVSYTKTTYKAGEFNQYAQRYLNLSNPITENDIQYALTKIESHTKGVIDKDKSYLVEFKPGTTAPFVTLTKEGIICAINDDYTFPPAAQIQEEETKPVTEKINPRSFLSEETLRAGSKAKQAELIAKQIYRLRETRNNILTGEADNMPPDGEAYKLVMKQLTDQENALFSLFSGEETTELLSQEFVIVPTDKDDKDRILFRFSSKLGIVGADDLSGEPAYYSLINKAPIEKLILTPKEEKALAEKFSKGIIYNIPGKAIFEISFSGKKYVDTEYGIAQFGTQDVLAPKIFENNKQAIKIIFYPELGSIKQIIQ